MTTEYDYYVGTESDNELTMAIIRNDETQVDTLLRQQSENININYDDGNIPGSFLSFAFLYHTNYRIISTLLHHDANPNIISYCLGMTPLHHACEMISYPLIEILLKFHANANCQDANGRTPLYVLLSSSRNYRRRDAHEEKLRCIPLLLDHQTNVNIHDNEGISCLFYVIQSYNIGRKKLDIIQLLLNDKNVDVNLQLLQPSYSTRPLVYNIKCDTILHYAVRKNDIDIVNMILKCNKLDIFIRNSNNETPYDLAQKLPSNETIIKCLKQMTFLQQCHIYLRQEWILTMKSTITVKKDDDDDIKTIIIPDDNGNNNKSITSSIKRHKK